MAKLIPMIISRRTLLRTSLATGAAFGAGLAASSAGALGGLGGKRKPIVLELFTSQGCSSCPPADRLLGELAEEPDLVTLAYHVDYWNYIGWKDPFSSKAMSDRQRRYGRAMRLSTIYTPQLVIDGEVDLVGSHRDRVLAEIKRRRERQLPAPVTVGLSRTGEAIELSLRPGGAGDVGDAEILLIGFDTRHVTEVPRGENRGRTLEDFAIVRFYRLLGTWKGEERSLKLKLDAGDVASDRLCVLVQSPGHGPILGAGTLDLRAG